MRRGLTFGAAAYLIWGLFPLYFPLLEPAGALEILAHRMVWSLVVSVDRADRGRAAGGDPRDAAAGLGLVLAGAVLIAVNWGIYIWAVNTGHVVEAALGYFINPLVTVLFGVLMLPRTAADRASGSRSGSARRAVAVLAVAGGVFPGSR